ncbi:MAG: hypothetical protein Q9163_003592 [Psora crenata]
MPPSPFAPPSPLRTNDPNLSLNMSNDFDIETLGFQPTPFMSSMPPQHSLLYGGQQNSMLDWDHFGVDSFAPQPHSGFDSFATQPSMSGFEAADTPTGMMPLSQANHSPSYCDARKNFASDPWAFQPPPSQTTNQLDFFPDAQQIDDWFDLEAIGANPVQTAPTTDWTNTPVSPLVSEARGEGTG